MPSKRGTRGEVIDAAKIGIEVGSGLSFVVVRNNLLVLLDELLPSEDLADRKLVKNIFPELQREQLSQLFSHGSA
jgi:hypothetical protein